MSGFEMCPVCQKEYDNPLERRHFSQTNSCTTCKIEMQLFENGELKTKFTDLEYIVSKWKEGKIIAIKGIGGYLLTCDATNRNAVLELRKRKQRPKKPFALMYPSIKSLKEDVYLSDLEQKELESITAPIVLLEAKQQQNTIALTAINSGLNRIGAMIPYTPLYELLLRNFGKPIIATSGNITDSTIIYTDKKALEELTQIADIILLNNRDIVIPQDDGVVQFTKKHQQKITLRRSRGKAPTYINQNINFDKETVFAAGAMLKSTFGLLNMQNTYVSQYLGNTAGYEAQLNYEVTYAHFEKIFQLQIDKVVIDKHPDYFATRFGKELAEKHQAEVIELQHHKAHFYSVLGENDLLDTTDEVLGVVWDGTGLGDDGKIWGGEFFSYNKGRVKRIAHIDEFDFILGDKMVKEPRISALAIAHKIKGAETYIKDKFTTTEWNIYQTLLQNTQLKSTSMGRVFDAVSSLLLDIDYHTFEAEASMKLEHSASKYYYSNKITLSDSYLKGAEIPANFLAFLMACIIDDLNQKNSIPLIATKFHITLVDYIVKTALKHQMKKLAFSGGVFQNTLLVDMLFDLVDTTVYTLFFQKEFSPNDEGLAFGQLIYTLNTDKQMNMK